MYDPEHYLLADWALVKIFRSCLECGPWNSKTRVSLLFNIKVILSLETKLKPLKLITYCSSAKTTNPNPRDVIDTELRIIQHSATRPN